MKRKLYKRLQQTVESKRRILHTYILYFRTTLQFHQHRFLSTVISKGFNARLYSTSPQSQPRFIQKAIQQKKPQHEQQQPQKCIHFRPFPALSTRCCPPLSALLAFWKTLPSYPNTMWLIRLQIGTDTFITIQKSAVRQHSNWVDLLTAWNLFVFLQLQNFPHLIHYLWQANYLSLVLYH